MIFRVSTAHEEGGDRVYAVSTQEFLGDETAASGRCGWPMLTWQRPLEVLQGPSASWHAT